MRRLNTKEGRASVMAYEAEILEKRGFKNETYKDLSIWTGFEANSYFLKIFKGTATNPLCYYRYRNDEEMKRSIASYKATSDRRTTYKAEQKSKTGFRTGAAACANAIKGELKNAFPYIKFSVTSETYSMGDSVSIHWNDGPTTSEVEKVTGKYQQGHFDGMIDMYENSNSRDDLPQAKYVKENRNQSEETDKKLIDLCRPIFETNDFGCRDAENMAYRLFVKTSFPKNGTIKGLEKTGGTCGLCDINVFYRVTFEGMEPEPEKEFYNWDDLLIES